MSDECIDELHWAQAGEPTLLRELTIQQRDMEKILVSEPARLLGKGIPEADLAYMERPEVIEAFRRITAEQAAHGVFGSVDDQSAFSKPWGFDVSTIAIPVLVTFGLNDVFTPAAHGEWIASRIELVDVRVNAEGGHMPTDPIAEIAETMAWLQGL